MQNYFFIFSNCYRVLSENSERNSNMVFDLSGKVGLITGGASGIGLSFAKTLLRSGAKGVTLADISAETGQKAIEDIEKEFGKNKAIFVETDTTDLSQFENAFKETIANFENIDILFNNSGILNDITWEKEIATNLHSTINGILLGLENYLQKYSQGEESVIVNTASVAGISSLGNLPIYSATKSAIISLTRSWGIPQHYDRTKVRLVAICPGATATPLLFSARGKALGEPYEKYQHDPGSLWPTQKPEFVAEETMKIIESADNGSIWVIEGSQPAYEYTFPARRQYTP